MNILEEGVIPLQGKGFVSRVSESYGPGEFKACENLILTPQGTLKKRRPTQGLTRNKTIAVHRLIGTNGTWAVGTAFDESLKYSNVTFCEGFLTTTRLVNNPVTFQNNLDAVSALPVGPTYDPLYKGFLFEGFFRYGDKDYYITLNIGMDTTLAGGKVIYGQSLNVISMDHPSNDVYDASLTFLAAQMGASIVKNTHSLNEESTNWVFKSYVSSFLVHKERLFIAVGDIVYWSKATDPTKFAVADDGGFIRFPGGKVIKKLLAIGDLIYVIFDNSVNVMSYNTSPNTDLQNREISPVIGGEDAVVYGDIAYLIKFDSLYAVSGTNITKAMDLELGFPLQYDQTSVRYEELSLGWAHQLKAEVFDDHLYIIKRTVRPHDDLSQIYAIRYCVDNDVLPSVINLDNGFVSRFSYSAGFGASRNPSDLIFIPKEDLFNQNKLVMLSHGSFNQETHIHHTGTRNPFYSVNNFVFDAEHGLDVQSVGAGAGVVSYCPIPIKLHISQYTPDELKYLNKKFRSVMLQLDAPMILLADESGYEPELELMVTAGRVESNVSGVIIKEAITGVVDTSPYTEVSDQNVTGYRFGSMQRATSVDIIIQTRQPVLEIIRPVDDTDVGVDLPRFVRSSVMELVDVRTLWTPTRRGRNNDPRSLS